MLRVGLVGCGEWGKHILRDLRALGCDVSVVARSDESRARAAEGGASRMVATVGELGSVGGVVVATPTSTHAAIVDEALELGVPVFCEKPLSNDVEAAERLAERAPDRLFVMDKWRYHPGVLQLAAIAREERLGPVAGIRSTRAGWGNRHADVDSVWVLAPHDLSIALEIMGHVATPQSAVAQWIDGRAVQLSGILRGDGWWHALEVSSRSAEWTRRVELHCEAGVAVLAGGWDEHVTVSRDRGGTADEERIETPGELPLLAELRAFVDHLEGGPPPRSSAAEGVAGVRTIARLRELARPAGESPARG